VQRVKVTVDQAYERWARDYDAYPNILIAAEEPRVRALLADTKGMRVLDVACGTGRHTLWLAERGAHVTGVDRSRAMLDVAREKDRFGIDWRVGDADALPVEDASFDVVLNALLLEHVEDIRPCFREAHRALVPGGRFVLSVFHPVFLLKGVIPHFEADGVEYEMPAFTHFPSEYVTAALELGMRVVHLDEPLVDDRVIAVRGPRAEKHRGFPMAIVMVATKTE
jgi:malonyl-CoA O-methyltransferase